MPEMMPTFDTIDMVVSSCGHCHALRSMWPKKGGSLLLLVYHKQEVGDGLRLYSLIEVIRRNWLVGVSSRCCCRFRNRKNWGHRCWAPFGSIRVLYLLSWGIQRLWIWKIFVKRKIALKYSYRLRTWLVSPWRGFRLKKHSSTCLLFVLTVFEK